MLTSEKWQSRRPTAATRQWGRWTLNLLLFFGMMRSERVVSGCQIGKAAACFAAG